MHGRAVPGLVTTALNGSSADGVRALLWHVDMHARAHACTQAYTHAVGDADVRGPQVGPVAWAWPPGLGIADK